MGSESRLPAETGELIELRTLALVRRSRRQRLRLNDHKRNVMGNDIVKLTRDPYPPFGRDLLGQASQLLGLRPNIQADRDSETNRDPLRDQRRQLDRQAVR